MVVVVGGPVYGVVGGPVVVVVDGPMYGVVVGPVVVVVGGPVYGDVGTVVGSVPLYLTHCGVYVTSSSAMIPSRLAPVLTPIII